MRPRSALGIAAAVAGAVVLLLPPRVALGHDSQTCTSLSVVDVRSPRQLAEMSEYLVTATLTTEPVKYALSDIDALRWWVGAARIEKVLGQRPDAPTRLSAGETVPLGTMLLRPRGICGPSNAAIFPTEGDRPHVGDSVVAFLVRREVGEFGPDYRAPGYEAAGQGLIDPDGTVTIRGVPGRLNHKRLPLAAVTTDVQQRYSRPAPWRQFDPDAVNLPPPPTSGPPAADPR